MSVSNLDDRRAESAVEPDCGTVCLTQVNGCPRARMDLERIKDFFLTNGWSLTTQYEEADIVVIAGCAFTDEKEKATLSYLRSVRHARQNRRKDAPIVLTGCISGIARVRLSGMPGIMPLTRDELERLELLVSADVPLAQIADPNVFEEDLLSCEACFGIRARLAARATDRQTLPLIPLYRLLGLRNRLGGTSTVNALSNGTPYRIRVATGCKSACTYCAIRLATGELCSKPLPLIVAELESGLALGFEEFELIAEDVGAYGQDCGATVVDLLRALLNTEGRFRISWADFGPHWLIRYFPELLELLVNHRTKIGSTGFPVQSGSDSVLKSMNREYAASDALVCLQTLKREIPEVFLGSHFICGFPGETEADFRRTMEFIRAVPFDEVTPYVFSLRSGTVAAGLRGQVPAWRRHIRAIRLAAARR